VDDEFRYFSIIVVAVITTAASTFCCVTVSGCLESQSAMEHGYEQVETESGKVLWKAAETRSNGKTFSDR